MILTEFDAKAYEEDLLEDIREEVREEDRLIIEAEKILPNNL